VDWLLGLVKYLSEHPNKTCMCDFKINKNVYQIIEKMESLVKSRKLKTIGYSILLRYSYGGMDGDKEMFLWYTDLILKKKILLETDVFVSIDINDVEPLDMNEILLAGADFHCFPCIIKKIQLKFPQYDNKLLRSVIWECSSSINKRITDHVIDDKLKKIWEAIRISTENIQKQLVIRGS
jgi:hypothetical protein